MQKNLDIVETLEKDFHLAHAINDTNDFCSSNKTEHIDCPDNNFTIMDGKAFILESFEQELSETHLKQQNQHLKVLLQEIKQSREIDLVKSEFLAMVSHELRTPLNSIMGFSELLKDEILGDLTSKQKNYCQDIYNSAQYLLSLINDILDLSKMDANKMQLDLEMINLPYLLKNCFKTLQELFITANVNLHLVITDDIHNALLDPRKFKQIILNLLSNALKFTPTGGTVTLKVEKNSNNMLVVQIIDTGIGMSEDNLKHLFKPFCQFTNQKGTGLGLVMVKRLVELHNGTVSVASMPNEGTTFTLQMPILFSLDL